MSAMIDVSRVPALHDHDDKRFDLTGNLEMFVRLAGDRLRYDPARRRWLVRRGDTWTPDDAAAMRTAGMVAEFVGDDARRSGDPKALAWARRSGMVGTMAKLVRLARTDPRLLFDDTL